VRIFSEIPVDSAFWLILIFSAVSSLEYVVRLTGTQFFGHDHR
jgi:hypothetical protein